jgi:integrase
VRLGKLLPFEVAQVRSSLKFHSRTEFSDTLPQTGGLARADESRNKLMARKRFQIGYIRVRGKHNPSWEGFYREDILLPEGRIVRKRRGRLLGSLAELPTKTLARRKLAEIVAELNEPAYQPRAVMTVAEFVENKYKTLILPVRKSTTRRGYEVVLRPHVLPEFAGSQLAEVTPEGVRFVINRKARSVAWNTLRNIRTVSSAIFAAAVKYGYVRSNPVRPVELQPEPVKLLPVLPSDKQLARPLDELPEPYRTMVWLVCISGVRISELLALRWRAVDWDRSCFWVVEAVDRNRFYSPKTHRGRRPILLADEDMKRLTEFRRLIGCAGEDDWLFLNRFGTGPIHADKALEKLQATAKAVGISCLNWHLLRHWHTTVLHDEGVPIKAAQDRLGHADAHTTMKHYVRLSRGAERQAADAV